LLPVASILVIGVGVLGAGTLRDLALALFVGMLAGTYSSITVATPVLAQLKEKQPEVIALAKRVASRAGDAAQAVSVDAAETVSANRPTGPRNQPRRNTPRSKR
ncbi:MAG: hypothetical protein RL038_305, partial [Actinomycetota bacterium]